jgi:hypothetical protein
MGCSARRRVPRSRGCRVGPVIRRPIPLRRRSESFDSADVWDALLQFPVISGASLVKQVSEMLLVEMGEVGRTQSWNLPNRAERKGKQLRSIPGLCEMTGWNFQGMSGARLSPALLAARPSVDRRCNRPGRITVVRGILPSQRLGCQSVVFGGVVALCDVGQEEDPPDEVRRVTTT